MLIRRRRWLRVFVLLLVLYAITITFGGCADRLLLPPVPKDVRSDGAERRIIPYDNYTMEAFIANSPGAKDREPEAFVLRFTGGDATGAAVFTASRWADRAVQSWVVNYPGYGASSEPKTLGQLSREALAAYDELKKLAGDRPIFLEGFSLGTAPAFHVMANRNVAGAILQNPPPLRELILGGHGWWNLWLIAGPVALQVPRELDSVRNAQASTAPCVFLLAERDRTIPPKYQQKITNAYKGPMRIIVQRGADHYVPLDVETGKQLQDAMDWLFRKGGK